MLDSLSTEAPRALAARAKRSVTLRLIVIGLLVLVLLIPLMMVRSTILERAQRRAEALASVSAMWGQEQEVGGPLMVVPFDQLVQESDSVQKLYRYHAYFLPEELVVQAEIEPERRQRGIFETVVYRTRLTLAGRFAKPDFDALGVAAESVRWDQAFLSFGVPDLRGVTSALAVDWDGRKIDLEPGAGVMDPWRSGIHAALPGLDRLAKDQPSPFRLELTLHGSESLKVLPLGRQTHVEMTSTWPDPSFRGAYLPARRQVSEQGFQAEWEVSELGRGFPQVWRSDDTDHPTFAQAVRSSALGVGLFLPADGYHRTERALKYGILFLLLTFATCFLFEVFHPVRLHPVQYLFVGAALCLFYLLLLALSEHFGFGLAYAAASAGTVALIGGYSRAILKARGRAVMLAAALAGLYGYLWVLLQAEDYALLLGATALFVILGVAMFLTRGVDWYVGKTVAEEVG
ncbi:MAG TPA: cell envelope integrity protein CreD [Thermoanaerobaculia bacterium]|nr:cell envelope integrity protein CreD [Thermoanaerobaculia bacterium]